MRKFALGITALYFLSLLLPLLAIRAAAQDSSSSAPNFVGVWQMTMSPGQGRGGRGGGFGGRGNGGGGNGGSGNNGGGNGGDGQNGQQRRGGGQTLTIARDGDNYKVTHTTPRGADTYDATVSGNSISWLEQREGRGGETMKIDLKATVDGDSMTGTMGAGQFTRNFTGTRQK